MIDLQNYLDSLISACKTAYGARLKYIGLQGSYLREDATESSDIDIMAVIDGFTVSDMDAYREILISLGDFEKSCGFICGSEDLLRWNPLEICQLLNTTKDIYGELRTLVPAYSREDERSYVKLSIDGIYHELCHRYIHAPREKSAAKLPLYAKPLFYVVQNLYYLERGEFIILKNELRDRVCEEDRAVLDVEEECQKFGFDAAFATVFEWLKKAMERAEKA